MDKSPLAKLAGCWETDPACERTQELYGRVIVDFSPEGLMVWTLFEDGKQKKIYLTYELDGEFLVTDQPSHPKIERTRFRFLDDDHLLLAYGGKESTFRRI